MPEAPSKAVVLFSGGLDSTTCAAIACDDGYEVHALSVNYSQRHSVELEKARILARLMNFASHREVTVDLRQFGGSALTSKMAVPKHETAEQLGADIPVTYVPARNTVMLSYALAFAEVIGAKRIYIGVNALDYSGYPDCRPEYIEAFQRMANLATKAGVEETETPLVIETPLIHLKKSEIIARGLALGVDYSLTHSCYDPDSEGRACGQCDSCLLRLKGFAENGLADPAPYMPAVTK